MISDAEHEQIGAVVGRDIAAVEFELGEVILVLNEGSNRLGHVVPNASQHVKAWGK